MANQWSGLQIAKEFCRRKSLPQPSTLVGSTDDTTNQILGLMNEGVMEMPSRFDLSPLQIRLPFTHAGGTGTEPYMALDQTVYPDWKHYILNTLWAKTIRVQVAGPLTLKQWQTLTTMLISSSRYQFTVYNQHIQIFPVVSPGTENFELYYQSRYAVFDPTAAGGAGATTDNFSDDTAYPLVPHEVILQDLKWRWLREKGQPYAEDLRSAEEMWANLASAEPASPLVLDAPDYDPTGIGPGLLVPAGNWGTFGPI